MFTNEVKSFTFELLRVTVNISYDEKTHELCSVSLIFKKKDYGEQLDKEDFLEKLDYVVTPSVISESPEEVKLQRLTSTLTNQTSLESVENLSPLDKSQGQVPLEMPASPLVLQKHRSNNSYRRLRTIEDPKKRLKRLRGSRRFSPAYSNRMMKNFIEGSIAMEYVPKLGHKVKTPKINQIFDFFNVLER